MAMTRRTTNATVGRTTGILVLLAVLATAAAQIPLITFTEGTTIRSDEVNQNFSAIAAAAERNRAKLDAIETGTLRVTPIQMAPVETTGTTASTGGTAFEYTRRKGGLLLLGPSDSGGLFCFASRIEIPDGAVVTSLASTLKADVGDLASASLTERAWADRPSSEIASVDAVSATYEDVVKTSETTTDLPVTVDATANEYRVLACLQGDGGFLGARVEYERP